MPEEEEPVQPLQSSYPIIKPRLRLNRPIERCPAHWAEALRSLPNNRGNRTLDIWETFLQVADIRLPRKNPSNPLSAAVELFVGAMHSSRFCGLSSAHRYAITKVLQDVATSLIPNFKPVNIALFEVTNEARVLAERFERLNLSEAKLALLGGWTSTNEKGMTRTLALGDFYQLYGAKWTNQLFETLDAHFRAGKGIRVVGIKELGKFLALHRPPPEALADPLRIGGIWKLFFDYFRSAKPKCSAATIQNNWICFGAIATKVLPTSGLFALPYLGFPGPVEADSPTPSAGTATSAAEQEEMRASLLLVDVPMQLSDSEALSALVASVPKALSIATRWSNAGMQDMCSRYVAWKKAAKVGQVRNWVPGSYAPGSNEVWKMSHDNPERMNNVASTYAEHGFQTGHDISVSYFYGDDLPNVARFLALPIAQSLLPFAAALVLEHPQLTPSALHMFELFNKNGELTGLRRTDSGTYMVTRKDRRGVLLGEQRIKLTAKSLRVIQRLLVLTRSVRNYLRAKGDDNWRYMFLETAQGFGYPSRVVRFTPNKSLVASQLQTWAGLTAQEANDMAKRFTLRTIRATVGIRVAIETHSEHRMSVALGHAQFDPKLLGRYLPRQLLGYFRVRWVRAFQTALVIQVTKGTAWSLRSSGFADQAQMDEFLEKNAFPGMETALAAPVPEAGGVDKNGALFFNANPQTLGFLARRSKVENGPPAYWSLFGTHLFGMLQARRGIDPSLDEMVDTAIAEANEVVA